MMSLLPTFAGSRKGVTSLLLVVGLFMVGCTTTASLRPQATRGTPAEMYGLTVVYKHPQRIVFAQARKAATALGFTIKETGTNPTYFIAQRPLKLGKIAVAGPGEILGVGAEHRRALVIGNAVYPTAPLRNSVNDATDIAAALRRLDFEVTVLRDATHEEMTNAVERFSQQLRQGGVGLLYYAGHGMQLSGENYLIPVDTRLQTATDVKFKTVPAAWVLERMGEAGNGLNMVILDACRDNPFVRSERSSQRGLAVMQVARGTLIAYATEPGGVALDGDERNGIYTKHLLRHIEEAELSVEQLFKRVRRGVNKETGGKQVPWEMSSLTGDFYFVPDVAIN